MMSKNLSRPHGGVAALSLAVVIALALAGGVRADSLKIAGSWLDNVTIQSVKEGQLLYTSATGADVEKSLGEIEGIKMTGQADLEAAQKAADAGDAKGAAASYQKALTAARHTWLKRWIYGQLIAVNEKGNQPADAVDAYLALAKDDKAEAFFFARPPVKSLAAATAEQKAEIRKRLTEAKADVTGKEAAAGLAKMLDALGSEAAAAPATPTAPGTGAGATPAPAAPAAAAPASVIPLPKALPENDPIAQLLRAGKFQEALTEVNKKLEEPLPAGQVPQTSRDLYERGVAQFNLAEKADGEAQKSLYMDAGLSFMRVVIHFPRNTTWVVPSLIEAGAVHDKIGRRDIAMGLWDRAKNIMNPDDDPELTARLEKLIAGDAPAEPPTVPPAAE